MAEKEDFYNLLGVSKDASQEEIKKLTESFLKNIIQTSIKKLTLKINLKKYLKHMKC